MRKVVVIRNHHLDQEELGQCIVFNEKGQMLFSCKTLELAWRDNKQSVSCVPEGQYDLKLEYSPRFDRMLWELKGVPGRSEAKFHAANYYRQLNGCIALGERFVDMNSDGVPDITNSRRAMDNFHKAMGDVTHATVTISCV